MRTTRFLLGASIAGCVVVAMQTASMQSPTPASGPPEDRVVVEAPPRTAANVPTPTLTPAETAALSRATAARLAAARTHAVGVAQRAVRDRDEGLFREPTAAEAAALALPAGTGAAAEQPISLGGYAVKTDASGVSLLVVTTGKDGTVTGHDVKGGHRDR